MDASGSGEGSAGQGVVVALGPRFAILHEAGRGRIFANPKALADFEDGDDMRGKIGLGDRVSYFAKRQDAKAGGDCRFRVELGTLRLVEGASLHNGKGRISAIGHNGKWGTIQAAPLGRIVFRKNSLPEPEGLVSIGDVLRKDQSVSFVAVASPDPEPKSNHSPYEARHVYPMPWDQQGIEDENSRPSSRLSNYTDEKAVAWAKAAGNRLTLRKESVSDALAMLESAVRALMPHKTGGDRSDFRTLEVVFGHGHNSQNRLPVLRPAVETWLKERELKYKIPSHNQGFVEVKCQWPRLRHGSGASSSLLSTPSLSRSGSLASLAFAEAEEPRASAPPTPAPIPDVNPWDVRKEKLKNQAAAKAAQDAAKPQLPQQATNGRNCTDGHGTMMGRGSAAANSDPPLQPRVAWSRTVSTTSTSTIVAGMDAASVADHSDAPPASPQAPGPSWRPNL